MNGRQTGKTYMQIEWIKQYIKRKARILKNVAKYEREQPHSTKGYYLIDGIRHINGLRLDR